jgi:aminopeptidase N
MVNADSPVDLSRWKEYYIAHEIAHQWWGQAVTGATYHDQWVSEGLAQFAAVFYLKTKLGDRVFLNILKKFSQWTVKKSVRGPITLGSRLSYFDFMAFQAIVYNKTAVVLNLLRELLGDETFFQGLRQFYEIYKYRGVKTENFFRTMERVSGKNLQAFFKGWFESHLLPEVFAAHVLQKTDDAFVLKFRVNQTKDVFVFPLWLEWQEDGKTVRQMVVIDEKTKEFEFRTSVKPVKIKINPDKLVPGKFS